MNSTDVIVIGSGFGGAVMACRLAAKGLKVVVLERGRRWDPGNFPREFDDPWIFDPDCPEKENGWLDLRFLDDMVVAQGAGVGGGSLIYANVSIDAPGHVFRSGWPSAITFDELEPYYRMVGEALELEQLPDEQSTRRLELVREAASAVGHGDRFEKLPLAVKFDPQWRYDLEDPFDHARSKPVTNAFGRQLGTCVHLGNCCVGCDVNARNTLDQNYLHGAEQDGADIRDLHLVECIEPDGSGYRVRYRDLHQDADNQRTHEIFAPNVVLAAGSLGSTELLLRCKFQHRTLPRIGAALGKNWSSNGDFLTPAFYQNRPVNPTEGPTITAAIDFLDGIAENQEFFIEDGGFPDIISNAIESRAGRRRLPWRYRGVARQARRRIRKSPVDGLMPWFAQGVDAADGELYLGRKWYAPWRRSLKLDWDIDRSAAVINAIIHMHRRLSDATGADHFIVPPTWTLLKNLVTPHPLGGCNMADDPARGVVDHAGRVRGYPGLHVVDGAIVPEAIGRNPSKTIAALAERCAALFGARQDSS